MLIKTFPYRTPQCNTALSSLLSTKPISAEGIYAARAGFQTRWALHENHSLQASFSTTNARLATLIFLATGNGVFALRHKRQFSPSPIAGASAAYCFHFGIASAVHRQESSFCFGMRIASQPDANRSIISIRGSNQIPTGMHPSADRRLCDRSDPRQRASGGSSGPGSALDGPYAGAVPESAGRDDAQGDRSRCAERR